MLPWVLGTWMLNSGRLDEQKMLVGTQPSLQPITIIYSILLIDILV